MPAEAANGGSVGVLDYKTAIDLLMTDYKRDGLDVKSLLDSDKRGGLT
jgi:IMP dehydrogenase